MILSVFLAWLVGGEKYKSALEIFSPVIGFTTVIIIVFFIGNINRYTYTIFMSLLSTMIGWFIASLGIPPWINQKINFGMYYLWSYELLIITFCIAVAIWTVNYKKCTKNRLTEIIYLFITSFISMIIIGMLPIIT